MNDILKISTSMGQREEEGDHLANSLCDPGQIALYLFDHSFIQQVFFEHLLSPSAVTVLGTVIFFF